MSILQSTRFETSRCYRCLGSVNMTAPCGEPGRSRCCWRCGVEGHTAAACMGKPQCYLCAERDKKPRTDHLPGTTRFAVLHGADSKRKPGELKISRIRNHSNPQNAKNATKYGPKSPHLTETIKKKTLRKQRKKKATFQNPFLLFLPFVLFRLYYPPPFT